MNRQPADEKHENQVCSYFKSHITSLKQINRVQKQLKKNTMKHPHKMHNTANRLFKLKIKHQILILTIMLISMVTFVSIVLNQIHLKIFASHLADGFNQILKQQNANFQSSVLINYMSVTKTYFFNDQWILMAVNQIYNHALKSEYTIDKGAECLVSNQAGKYPNYIKIDQFCYVPMGSTDLQTFENSTENTQFVKFTNVLNQYILCFHFPLSYKINNYIQINLDNQEEMVSVYPYIPALKGYSPRQRPFFIFQKQQYENKEIKKYYVCQYFKWFNIQGGTLYGQTLSQSLLNGTQFKGVIALTIQFNVFDEIFNKFPDVNLALVANDGTLLYQQTQFQIYNQQQFIYNQSATGYNYLGWLNLSTHQDYTSQIIINNNLLPQPINVNIKKFKDLPYYSIVYNNLTYEKHINNMQLSILKSINDKYNRGIVIFIIFVSIILIACYFLIERLLQPIVMIKKLIYCYDETFKDFGKVRSLVKSNNMLDILLLVIYFKYSQLQNLSFKKNLECQQIEDRMFPLKYNLNSEDRLIRYLQNNQFKLADLEVTTDFEFAGYLFTLN